MRRRDLLKYAAWSAVRPALTPIALADAEPGSVIDTHIHLFDPLRPGGVPWPEKTDSVLYQPALPDRYQKIAAPFGVVGAVAIECSPLTSDNQWLLNVAVEHPLIVGVVGDLVPGAAGYLDDLDRLVEDPLFLGIRYGNLWNRDLAADLDKPGFVDGLQALAARNLVFESANPDTRLIGALRTISEQVPGLRIVIDHLPHAELPAESAARDAYWADLGALGKNPKVYAKLSEIPVRTNGKLETKLGVYRAKLDALWQVFGEDRVLFGSDWPNSDHVATYAQTFAIVRSYVLGKKAEAREKFFWKNSVAAYQWKPRRSDQPAL
jgi:L-fuconolactonase